MCITNPCIDAEPINAFEPYKKSATMPRNYSDTTIIAPTLNEEENIGGFLAAVTKRYPGISVVVPDDGSSDSTVGIVRRASRTNQRIRLLDRSRRSVHGVTASILDAAMAVRTPKIISMDADFQHPVDKIGKIADALDGSDIVVGVRAGRGRRNLYRMTMSKGLIAISLAVFKLRGRPTCNDMASGFLGMRTKLLKGLISSNRKAFVEQGNKTLLDMLRITGEGTRICEVTYPNFPERKRGKSKMKAGHILLALMSVIK